MNSKNNISYQLDQITSISLLEDLQSQDNRIKINAIHNLKQISLDLGYETTRKELLPFIKNCINNEEEDEILIELAKILSIFLPCIGGVKYINELLNIFEVILSIDEPSIRKEAINSLHNVLNQIDNMKEIENQMMNLIKNFYMSDDINQKLSAMNLIILLYKDLSENNKKIVINYLENFSSSDNINIKKELMNEIIKISNYLSIDYIKKFITSMMKEENENIKIDIISFVISLKEHKDLILLLDYIYDLIQKLSEDNNYKVRLSLINNLSEILIFPKINYNFKQLALNIYIKLMEDSEVQIRNACCLNLEQITKLLKNEINFNKILQNLNKLIKDERTIVRNSLSENIYKISPLLNKKQLNEIIFPIYSELILDENVDIRINSINNIINISKNLDINNILAEKIISIIIEIAQNKSWRIRNKIINIIPNLINQKKFMRDLFPICLNYLTDHVFAIRDGDCKLLCNIYKNIKNIEFENKLIEKLNLMSNLTNYLIRNTCLIFIKYFIENIDDKIYFDFFQKNLIYLVYKLSNDKISNIRMNCAFIFNKVKDLVYEDKSNTDKIKKYIDKFKNDEDRDVVIIFK